MLEERESYKHLFAKNLLKRWFLEQDTNNDFCSVAQFNWRSNYGIFTELEFYETSNPFYFELSDGLREYSSERSKNPLDWFDPDFNRGKILFVPDITLFHKGSAVKLLEVVHTNSVPDWKKRRIEKFFAGNHIEVYEIQAEEILRHDKTIVPAYLECRQII